MLLIEKRAGAAPQQCCKSQNEQEVHHSNIANLLQFLLVRKPLHILNCAKYLFPRRTTMVWTHARFVQIGTWSGVAPQQRCELQNEQELRPSNPANYKTRRSFTTATLWSAKRAGVAPQQHCELQNEQELHHDKILNKNTSRSCSTATQQSTIRARAAPQQHCEPKRNGVVGHIYNPSGMESHLNTFWICA